MNAKDPHTLPRPDLPATWTRPPRGRVLVLAPHADDEVCGLGGALALHVAQGDPVQVDWLTAGTTGDPEGRFGDIAACRAREAEAALAALGVPPGQCWGLPDNFEITRADLEGAVERILARLAETGADLLYHPWRGECHSDHHATALAAEGALKRRGGAVRGLAYEVWSPLPARFILDITPVAETKRAALEAYASQLHYTDYRHHTFGLNAHRGIFLPGRHALGEAFLPSAGSFTPGGEGP